MKKLFFGLSALFIFGTIFAQKESSSNFTVSTGVWFAPQASMSLKADHKKGLDPFWRLHGVVTVAKGNYALTGMYTVNTHAMGAALTAKIPNTYVVMYSMYSRRFLVTEDYLCVGASVLVAKNIAGIFAEVGSPTKQFAPILGVGVVIPLTLTIFNGKVVNANEKLRKKEPWRF